MTYKAKFPITHDMSPVSFTVSNKRSETKEQEALWHYNKSREHDGLEPLSRLPKGVKFERVTK